MNIECFIVIYTELTVFTFRHLAYCFHFQAFCKVGQFIAGQLGLGFSKDGLQQKQVEKSKRAQEPWRSLYL